MKSALRYFRYPLNAAFIFRAWLNYYIWGIFGPFLGDEVYQNGLKKMHAAFARMYFERAITYKGLLIKIGQVLSSRADVMPREYIEVLAKLQDKIPPVSFDLIRSRIEAECGKPLDEIFSKIEETPIASASIGQVHEAWLLDGTHVAVKVQYPQIEQVITADLRALRLGFKLFSLRVRVRTDLMFDELKRVLMGELNYVREGKFAERFSECFKNDKNIIAPKIYWDYTTTKVLVMEFVSGQKITEFAATEKDQVRRARIIERLVDVYSAQIFKFGFFHADPHPGNIFITERDEIVFVDFGICSELDADTRDSLRQTARAIINFDVEEMVEGIKQLGVISLDEDERRTRDLLLFAVREFKEISPKEYKDKLHFGEWLDRLHNYFHEVKSFLIPHKILLFLRTVSILEGHLAVLDPKLNLINIAKPYIKRYVMEEKPLLEYLADEARHFLMTVFRIPNSAERFLERTNRGSTFIRTSDSAIEKMVALLPAFFFAAITCIMLFTTPIMFYLGKNDYGEIAAISSGVFFIFTLRAYLKAGRK